MDQETIRKVFAEGKMDIEEFFFLLTRIRYDVI
jgi:hypothetical protein